MARKKTKARSAPSDGAARKTVESTSTAPSSRFPIVGIGASAGGLAAFEAFFSGMPANNHPDMALVLVQHLAPDHKSILTELVQRYTRMRVFEVRDGMTVRLNCAYIIPPGRDMALLGGALQLLEPSSPRGQRMPIDFFFRSLAQDQRERAIGIVLSGTGSDGTLGVRAIKGEGGMVMVQDPASTEYDGMPRSALATRLVDYELLPAEMPAQIIAYATRAIGNRRRPTATEPQAENAVKKILVLLRDQTGHDFSQYKPSTVERRVARRMAIHQIETQGEYLRYTQQTPTEVEALFRDLLIGVTSFFRDPEAFKILEERVLPKLFSVKAADGGIRMWSAGCSTGEEAYSLAILVAEHQEAVKRRFTVQIFATDIDSQAIATARAGLYPASIAADLSPERLGRYFSVEPDGGTYLIHKSIRDMIVFSEQDVVRDPPFSRLDLICCRNLLIYMSSKLQERILSLFHYALNPNRSLFLGSSETVGELGHLFATLDRTAKLYQRREDPPHTGSGRFLPHIATTNAPRPQTRGTAGHERPSLRALAEQALLQQYAAAALVVDVAGDIRYVHGRTGLYLEPTPGETGMSNLLKMAREGLQRNLAMALRRAARGREVVDCPNGQVRTNGGTTTVHVTVRTVSPGLDKNPDEPLFVIILDPVPPLEPVEASAEGATAVGDAHISELRRELKAKEEYLEVTIEELQTSNEELKSSMEEMQSVNEELQSTNEELETSKEELQSVNEELATVNAELQAKVADLSQANNDMNNLLAGTGIATVFVDNRLRILRFTPAAAGIINLIKSDIGRPVGHIASNLEDYDALVEDAQAVLDTLAPKEMEVRSTAGAWYAMRIRPYRTMDNVIEGAVITFVDISTAKRAQEALDEAHVRMTEAMVATVREPLLVLDADLRIVSASRAYFDTFRVTPDATIGQLLFEVGNRQWKTPALRKLMEETLVRDSAFHDRLLSYELEGIGRRTLRLDARRLVGEGGRSELTLLVIEDVSGQRAGELT